MSDNIKKLGCERGYTLVELVVSIGLMGILLVSVLAISVNYLALVTRNNISVDMTVDSQNLLRKTVEELRYGAGVREANTISDPNSPVEGWTTNNSDFVIIIAQPAENSSKQYIINSLTGLPYNNELVYFKSGNVLYQRTLANSSASGNTAQTSCPAALATPSCPADIKLIEYIEDMNFTLYDQDDVATNNPLLARSVKIDLSVSRDTFGQPLTLENSIRVTLRNNF